jgi:acetolactate synthase I/II/III large subunit
MGLGAFPGSDPQFLGMLGMHGTYEANLAMYNCDVMINIGARFDDRVTGRLDEFSPRSKKIHVDIDAQLDQQERDGRSAHRRRRRLGAGGSAGGWNARKLQLDQKALKAWWRKIEEWRARDCLKFEQKGEEIKPQYAIKRLYELTKDRSPFITTEVGQHQMWAAQYFKFEQPNHWMTSGGLGTMGYGCRRPWACSGRIPTRW